MNNATNALWPVRGWAWRKLALLTCGAALVLPLDTAPASAQTGEGLLEEVVVTATRIPTRIEDVGSSVSVITREEIEQRQFKTVTEALRTVPGVHMVQTGPRGQVSSVFTRGANSNQTLVLLNGRRFMDPGTPAGAFNFAHLNTANVERIEVVRGPQSALFGSDAIAGVINIVTRDPIDEGVAGTITSEVGSFGTFEGSANVTGRQGRIGFDATLSGLTTAGDTVTPERFRPEGAPVEDNAARNVLGNARLDYDIADNLTFSAFGQVLDAHAELDTAPEDPNSVEDTRQYFTSAELAGEFMGGRYRPTLTFAYSEFERENRDDPDAFSPTFVDTRNQGDRIQIELQNEYDIHPDHTLIFGGEVQEESFEATGIADFGGGFVQTPDSSARVNAGAVYLQDVFHLTERLSGTVGVRYDAPEDFDNRATWHIAPSYAIPETGTRLKASVGTGFKVPALFERFGFTPTSFGTAFRGNPDLDAEKSFGFDVGFEQSVFQERVSFGSTFFYSDVEDAVVTEFDQNFNSTTVNNVDLDIYGFENFVSLRPVESLTLTGNYTFTRADDSDTGLQLIRRPKHKVSADAVWQFTERTNVALGMVAVAGMKDIGRFGGRVDLPSYAVFRAAGSYAVTEAIAFTARVENLFDRDFETADGFKAPGLEGFVGARLTF